jgi:hypothetical protein
MTTTFKCHDVEPHAFFNDYNREKLEEKTEAASNGSLLLDGLNGSFDGGVEAANINLRDGWVPWFRHAEALKKNAFIESLLMAYNMHWEMVFAPDDLWLCIANGFAKHVNANAEELRHQFVDWDGKKALTVRRDSFIKGSPLNDWPGVFSEFSDQLADFIGKKRDLVVADFSTTGPIEKAASEVVLMDAMQAYFEYHVMTCSGFSKITVLGTPADWENIKHRVRCLAEFGLEWWTVHVEPIIDQFIAAAKGNADTDFWQRCVCRLAGSGRDAISGWATALFPYLKKGKRNTRLDWQNQERWRGVEVSDFEQMVSKAPFLWNYHGREIEMEFLGGVMAPAIDIAGERVRAATGWAIREQK